MEQFMSDNIDQISIALSKAQQDIDVVVKDTKAYSYKYATLASVQDAVKKPFTDNELSYSHITTANSVKCLLMHKSGQWLCAEYPLNATASKTTNINQALGSSITYGRRYTLASIAGVPQQDDDAFKADQEKTELARKNFFNKVMVEYFKNLKTAEEEESQRAYSNREDVKELFKFSEENGKCRVLIYKELEKYNLTELLEGEYYNG